MKITDHIKNAQGKTLFSFEVIPPKKGNHIQDLYKHIDPLMRFAPPFIDVTTSREQYIYIEHKGGLLEKRITRMRPGTLGICAAIQHKYNVDAVPHVLCGGFTKEETEYLLVDCNYLGIDNVVALRGDAMREERYFTCAKGGHRHASELVAQIHDMNRGKYLHETIDMESRTDFCIGVAGYPEKHLEAPSMEFDLDRLEEKVKMGADYIVTQMFFDNEKYFSFVDKLRARGINVPVIPGIKPIATRDHLRVLPQAFKVDLPDTLVASVQACRDNTQVRAVGIEWAVAQSRELKKRGVPVLHYYSMGRSDNIVEIVSQVF